MADAASRLKKYNTARIIFMRALQYAYLEDNKEIELIIYDKLG